MDGKARTDRDWDALLASGELRELLHYRRETAERKYFLRPRDGNGAEIWIHEVASRNANVHGPHTFRSPEAGLAFLNAEAARLENEGWEPIA
jgi:hypothetical protein